MRHRVFLLSLFFLFAAAPLFATPDEDEDFAYWSQNDAEFRLRPDLKLRAGEELRFREHQGLYYFDTHVGVNYQPWQYLAMGADYLQVRQTRTARGKDIWYWEERPRPYLTPQIKIRGFQFEDRNMLEIRFKQETENTVRYRNLVSVTAPWKWTPLEAQPYCASEIFIESNRKGVVEDRLYAGFKLHFWKNLSGSLFYMREFLKNNASDWRQLNVFGSGFKVVFG